MKLTQVFILILAVTIAAAVVGLKRTVDQAPELTLQTLDGRALSLSQLRGKPVLVTFWATTCPVCVKEIPYLARLYEELRPQGLELIAIAMAYDPPSYVMQMAQQRRIPYPVALDVHSTAAESFGGVTLIPAAFLISPQGHLAQRYLGEMDLDQVRRAILQML